MKFLQLTGDDAVVNVDEIAYVRAAVDTDFLRSTVSAETKAVVVLKSGVTLYVLTPYDEILAVLWMIAGGKGRGDG